MAGSMDSRDGAPRGPDAGRGLQEGLVAELGVMLKRHHDDLQRSWEQRMSRHELLVESLIHKSTARMGVQSAMTTGQPPRPQGDSGRIIPAVASFASRGPGDSQAEPAGNGAAHNVPADIGSLIPPTVASPREHEGSDAEGLHPGAPSRTGTGGSGGSGSSALGALGRFSAKAALGSMSATPSFMGGRRRRGRSSTPPRSYPEAELQRCSEARDGRTSWSKSSVHESMVPEGLEGTRPVRGIVAAVVHSGKFESFISFLIFVNAIFFGIEAELMAIDESEDPPLFFEVASYVFSGIFIVELALRIFVDRTDFCSVPGWSWNIFDALIVSASLVEFALPLVLNGDNVQSLSTIRLLRIVRSVRLLRIVRVMKYFRSLRILVYSVMGTLRSLVWTMLLLLAILYLFGILFTQAATQELATSAPEQRDDNLKKYYGGVFLSVFTLFKSIAGGLDWHDVVVPLGAVHPVWVAFFMLFFSFTYLAVLNVVTGVFVQTAIESAIMDQDLIVQEMLAAKKEYSTRFAGLFKVFDTGDTGTITLQQFEEGLKDERVKAYFASMELTVDEAFSLFTLLDTEETHIIDIDAFVTGCLRLRGNAKSIDVAMMMYQSRWAAQRSLHHLAILSKQVKALVDLHGLEVSVSASLPITSGLSQMPGGFRGGSRSPPKGGQREVKAGGARVEDCL